MALTIVLTKKAALNYTLAQYQDGSPELLTWNDETGDVSKQVTQLISSYADFAGVVAWKIAAVETLLGKNCFLTYDGETGAFQLEAFGLQIYVDYMSCNVEGDEYDVGTDGGFWELDDFRCRVQVLNLVGNTHGKHTNTIFQVAVR